MYPELMSGATELESTFGALLDQVPLVKNRTSVTELSGGLTNRNLAIESDGTKYVARTPSWQPRLELVQRFMIICPAKDFYSLAISTVKLLARKILPITYRV